jgi:integrase
MAEGDGTWIAKHRGADGMRQYKSLGGIAADGKRDPFDIASKLALAWFEQLDAGIAAAGTVADACRAYVAALKIDRPKASTDAEGRFKRLLYSAALGRVPLERLQARDVRAWLDAQVPGDDEDDPDAQRRAKDSANRNLTALKAALNLAYRDKLIASDHAWRTVKPYSGVAGRRTMVLAPAQRKALLAAADKPLRHFLQAAMLTGARPGELAAATVADFDPRAGTLRLVGKTGARTVPVSTQMAKLAKACCKDRIGKAPLFDRGDGKAWERFYWRDKVQTAAKAAQLPGASMYALRHTAITEMVLGGLDLLMVARLTGTSVAMIDKHYGHLAQKAAAAALNRVRLA